MLGSLPAVVLEYTDQPVPPLFVRHHLGKLGGGGGEGGGGQSVVSDREAGLQPLLFPQDSSLTHSLTTLFKDSTKLTF